MGFIAFGADDARRLKSTHQPKARRHRSGRSLADDQPFHLRLNLGLFNACDEDCEPGNWLESIDQTRIAHFDLTWTSNDMEIDDGM